MGSGTGKSRTWGAKRDQRASRDRENTLRKALDRIADVIIQERRDPTAESLTKVLEPVLNPETVRKYKKGEKKGSPWTWDYFVELLREQRPAVYLALLEVQRDESLDPEAWTTASRPFPPTIGQGRLEALSAYLDRQDDLIAAAPRRMLDREIHQGERATAYCEAAIQRVRLHGRASTSDADWTAATRAGKVAMRSIAPVVRLADHLGQQQRQAVYSLLVPDNEDTVREQALADLRAISKWRPLFVAEYAHALDRDWHSAGEEPPVAIPFLANPEPIPANGDERNTLPWDAAEILLTRYSLLAGETVYAMLRSHPKGNAATALNELFGVDNRGTNGALPIPVHVEFISPIVGMASCAILDSRPGPASASRAIRFVEEMRDRDLWPFEGFAIASRAVGELEAASDRALSQVWIGAQVHEAIRNIDPIDELGRYLTARTPPTVNSQLKPFLTEAEEHWHPLTCRTSAYQPDPTIVACTRAVTEIQAKGQPTDDEFRQFLHLADQIARRFSDLADDPVDPGVNFVDPVSSEALVLLAGLVEFWLRSPAEERWFEQIARFHRSAYWQALPGGVRHQWEEDVINEYSINADGERWDELLERDRLPLPIPVDAGISKVDSLLDDLRLAFSRGASLSSRAAMVEIVQKAYDLHVQALMGENNRPAPVAPTDDRRKAIEVWRHLLGPALRGHSEGGLRYIDGGPLRGRFELDGTDQVVHCDINWVRAELCLWTPIPMLDTGQSDLKELLGYLLRIESGLSPDVDDWPRVGLTLAPPPYLTPMEDPDSNEFAIRTVVPMAGLTEELLIRTVEELANHPLNVSAVESGRSDPRSSTA